MPAPKELDPTSSLAAYLGAQIRRRREALGLTQKQLGQMVFVSHNRIAQIELATDPPGREMIKLLDAALRANGELIDLWGHLSDPKYDHFAKTFLHRQAEASMIQEYSLIIPGLLQTKAYMRAIFADADGVLGDGTTEEKFNDRLARQRILHAENPPWYRMTLHESALYLPVGGHQVMRGQLAHLLEVGQRRNVDVQVVPLHALPLTALGGSLCLLTMPDGSRSAYTEGLDTGQFSEQPADVTRLTVIYDRVQAAALGPEMSAAFIRNVMEERYTWEPPPLT
ncbi:helix-turn-helix domain-containing protein [Kitasatospora sp. NBC_01250]|uniref:helix-turn-helix domain-containing protein n=1 Tax=unclassified Kitasatospora TaxID=2633591 RepID=UPI002E11EDC0|nr:MULTISPECIES: helix-turn-helix transcriptional regulator [unclassified Kitasatospora]WSJ67581.1 helix-turn-helix domain-containing protein [Kitasatospora sp. NBC_01302]